MQETYLRAFRSWRSLLAGHQPGGLARDHPAQRQHGRRAPAEQAPTVRADRRAGRLLPVQPPRRHGPRAAGRGRSTGSAGTRSWSRRRRCPRELPRGRGARGHRRVLLRRCSRDPRRPHRDGDVSPLPGPAPAEAARWPSWPAGGGRRERRSLSRRRAPAPAVPRPGADRGGGHHASTSTCASATTATSATSSSEACGRSSRTAAAGSRCRRGWSTGCGCAAAVRTRA